MVEITPKVFDCGEGTELFHGVLPCVGILLVACDVFPQHPLCCFLKNGEMKGEKVNVREARLIEMNKARG